MAHHQQVNGGNVFKKHYNQILHFHGEHRMNNGVIETVLVPLIRKIC